MGSGKNVAKPKVTVRRTTPTKIVLLRPTFEANIAEGKNANIAPALATNKSVE